MEANMRQLRSLNRCLDMTTFPPPEFSYVFITYALNQENARFRCRHERAKPFRLDGVSVMDTDFTSRLAPSCSQDSALTLGRLTGGSIMRSRRNGRSQDVRDFAES